MSLRILRIVLCPVPANPLQILRVPANIYPSEYCESAWPAEAIFL